MREELYNYLLNCGLNVKGELYSNCAYLRFYSPFYGAEVANFYDGKKSFTVEGILQSIAAEDIEFCASLAMEKLNIGVSELAKRKAIEMDIKMLLESIYWKLIEFKNK